MLKRTLVIGIGSGALAAVVLAIAVALAFRLYSDPSAELVRMAEAMAKVNTFAQRSSFTWTLEGDATKSETVTLSGAVDLTGIDDVRHATEFRDVRKDGEKTVADVSGEVRTVDGTTYVLTRPTSTTRKEAKSISWISFEQGNEALLGYVSSPLMPLPDAPWLPGTLLRWRAIVPTVSLFVVDHADLVEPIGGVVTRRFETHLDSDGLNTFLLANAEARVGRELTTEERVAVAKWSAALKGLSVKLWVGKEDHLLYRMQVEGYVVLSEEAVSHVKIQSDLSRYNQPVTVEVPSSVVAQTNGSFGDGGLRELGELVESTDVGVESEGFVSETEGSSIPKTHDDDEDGLDNVLESFYGSNPLNPDTDGDGVSDGDEVKAMRSPTGSGGLYGMP